MITKKRIVHFGFVLAILLLPTISPCFSMFPDVFRFMVLPPEQDPALAAQEVQERINNVVQQVQQARPGQREVLDFLYDEMVGPILIEFYEISHHRAVEYLNNQDLMDAAVLWRDCFTDLLAKREEFGYPRHDLRLRRQWAMGEWMNVERLVRGDDPLLWAGGLLGFPWPIR